MLLLTNLVSPTLEEDEIQSAVEKLVDFGTVHECKILKVPNVPEEDAGAHISAIRFSASVIKSLCFFEKDRLLVLNFAKSLCFQLSL